MVVRKRILWWLVMVLLCLLAAVVGAAVAYRRHTVPLDECSEVYRRYHKAEGIQAAFIRDMPINDSLNVDMTLLVADDSLTFVNLLKDFGKSDEIIDELMQHINGVWARSSKIVPKGHPELPADRDNENNEIMAVIPEKRSTLFFHPQTPEQFDAIIDFVLFEKVNI